MGYKKYTRVMPFIKDDSYDIYEEYYTYNKYDN